MMLTRQTASSGMQLLIVQGELKAQNQIEIVVGEYFEGKAHLSIKNATVSSCELVYKVGERVLKNASEKQQLDIVQKLLKVEGVMRVNLVEQQDDISR